MKRITLSVRCILGVTAASLVTLFVVVDGAHAQWPRFAGPTQNFHAGTESLPTGWGEKGPKVVWQHELGAGDSSITVADDALFTMYRDGKQEFVVALDEKTGERLWEYHYAAPLPPQLYVVHGDGPHATPLVQDGRLFTIGITGLMHGLDRKTGKKLWSHDLVKEFGARLPDCGHSASAVPWKKTVIVPVGGVEHGVMAFDAATGKTVWKSSDQKAGYATPLVINVDGEDELIVFMAAELLSLNPDTGTVNWRVDHKTEHGVNASMPVWSDGNVLFISSAYGTGSRALRLTRKGSRTTVEELWYQKEMQVQFGSVIRIGDYYYGMSGDRGPSLFTAANAKTGEIAWRKRSDLGRASSLRVGDKLLMLGNRGKLVLASVSPEGFSLEAEYKIFEETSWSIPTLVGTRLYVRTPKQIMALDLDV